MLPTLTVTTMMTTMTMTTLFPLLLSGLLTFHPGHSTRVELQVNAEQRTLELAMRIDHSDLESALRKRFGIPLITEKMQDDEAQERIGTYLRESLRLDNASLRPTQFRWVGWERRRLSSWIYAEIVLAGADEPLPETFTLEIKTLLEVEPELNHVVAIRQGEQTRSVVLDRTQPRVRIPTSLLTKPVTATEPID
ncbi:MAG: hypothetical protein EA381_17315 [Planctomycetaceae bacterium]|nr:MAG: hypothetical protein EA381_17315 [Planctomycetaceae bacterium]